MSIKTFFKCFYVTGQFFLHSLITKYSKKKKKQFMKWTVIWKKKLRLNAKVENFKVSSLFQKVIGESFNKRKRCELSVLFTFQGIEKYKCIISQREILKSKKKYVIQMPYFIKSKMVIQRPIKMGWTLLIYTIYIYIYKYAVFEGSSSDILRCLSKDIPTIPCSYKILFSPAGTEHMIKKINWTCLHVIIGCIWVN